MVSRSIITGTKIECRVIKADKSIWMDYLGEIFEHISDIHSIMLWDDGDEGYYPLAVYLEEYNYPTEPNYVEAYYFYVSREDFSVTPDKGTLKRFNTDYLSEFCRLLVSSVDGIAGERVHPDLVLLDLSNIPRKKVMLIGDNDRGSILWEEESTEKCRKVVYISY